MGTGNPEFTPDQGPHRLHTWPGSRHSATQGPCFVVSKMEARITSSEHCKQGEGIRMYEYTRAFCSLVCVVCDVCLLGGWYTCAHMHVRA